VPRRCILLNLSTGFVLEKAQMITGRYGHGCAHVGTQVYVVGGVDPADSLAVRYCERYDIFDDSWHRMS